jgi:ring-1,2-phenylacetyl-CoA epoxidase subunit PaaE
MAFVGEGQATMRFNNVLSADEVDEGWVLTCQAIPTSPSVVVDYDR